MTALFTTMTNGQDGEPTRIALKVLTGVSGIISAAHRSKDGNLHGHTWEVVAWWAEGPCAVERKAALTKYLSTFDHAVLADDCAWGEALATAILLGMNCEKVEVRRPLEGLFAVAERLRCQPPGLPLSGTRKGDDG